MISPPENLRETTDPFTIWPMPITRRALSIRRDPYYLDTLANIYGRMGKYEEAVVVIEEAIGITESEQVDLLFSEYRLLGDLYEMQGKEELAAGSRKKAEAYRRKHP